MATQSLEFQYTEGQTITAQIYPVGSDTITQTASAVVEATNRKGRYVATFTDAPAGQYLLIYYISGVSVGYENYTLTDATATFYPWTETAPDNGECDDTPPRIYRSVDDNQAIRFSWPTSNALGNMAATVSVDEMPFIPVAGALTYEGDEYGRYIYRIAYNAADRPSPPQEGTSVYQISDNTYSLTIYLHTTTTDINMDQSTPDGNTTGEQLDKAGTGGGGTPTDPDFNYIISMRFVDQDGSGVVGTYCSIQGSASGDKSTPTGYAELGVEIDGVYVITVIPPAGYTYSGTLTATVAGSNVDLGDVVLDKAPVTDPPNMPPVCSM